jgi:hypothetical protein
MDRKTRTNAAVPQITKDARRSISFPSSHSAATGLKRQIVNAIKKQVE